MTTPPKKKIPPSFVGISITSQVIEAALLQPSKDVTATPHKIVKSVSYPIPEGVMSSGGDEIKDVAALTQILTSVMDQLKPKSRTAHLSIPATLLRYTEMPKMQPKELYLSLSSEAERYKIFDDTEAVVDFATIEAAGIPANQCRVVFGAVRNDTLNAYKAICQKAKIKIASIDLEPLNVLRGMAGSAVLDSLVQQIGPNSHWGSIFVENERVRLILWQGNNLVDLREIQMETRDFVIGDPNSFAISDLLDEVQRTTKNNPPAIWLTHKMPEVTDKILSERLSLPVRSCLVGPAVTLDQPTIQVSTVGASLRSTVSFPFDFDLLTSTKTYAAPSAKAAKPDSKQQEAMMAFVNIGGGALALVSLLILGVMAIYNEVAINGAVKSLNEEQLKLDGELASEQSKIDALQGQSAFVVEAIETRRKTMLRNLAFVDFVEDLKQKTPGQVWVHSIKILDQYTPKGSQEETLSDVIILEGRATEHQSAINLAKNFDLVPYAKDFTISSIKEGFVGDTPIFNFEIIGRLNTSNDKLLEAIDSTATPPSDGTTPTTEEVPNPDEASTPSTDSPTQMQQEG